jgi:hypothetical protein
LTSYLTLAWKDNKSEADNLDTGYAHSYQFVLTADTTQTLSATVQSLTGEITSGNLCQYPYINSAGLAFYGGSGDPPLQTVWYGSQTVFVSGTGFYEFNSAPSDSETFGLGYWEISAYGISASAVTIRRALIRANNGKMRYVFDLPAPLILTVGQKFRIDFRHYFAGTQGW